MPRNRCPKCHQYFDVDTTAARLGYHYDCLQSTMRNARDAAAYCQDMLAYTSDEASLARAKETTERADALTALWLEMNK